MKDKKQRMRDLLSSFEEDLKDPDASNEWHLTVYDLEILVSALTFALGNMEGRHSVVVDGVKYVPEGTQNQ